MSIKQSMALKGAYNVMKAKLSKNKTNLPYLCNLDLSLKLEYIPMDEHEYIMQHLKNMLQLMRAPPTSSTCTQGETLLSNSTAY